MASTKPGHVALNGLELVIQDETYLKQLQTPFNPRFSTGDPNLGDLSYFQYLSMEDWSGGSGQDIHIVSNRFDDAENMDVTTPGELKLAPYVDYVESLNGPEAEHLNRPDVQEDAWPQIIEWLGQAIIYNDRIEYDAGGVEFLEVFDTEVLQDKVIGHDASGTSGVKTPDTRAEIVDISKVAGLPGDTVLVTVKFKNPAIQVADNFSGQFSNVNNTALKMIVPGIRHATLEHGIDIDFYVFMAETGQKDTLPESNASKVTIKYARALFSNISDNVSVGPTSSPATITLTQDVVVEFTFKIPNWNPGIYSIYSFCRAGGGPFVPSADNLARSDDNASKFRTTVIPAMNRGDTFAHAGVLFFIQDVDSILVTRKSIYAPQLRASTTLGSQLVGGRVINGKAYIEVYTRQNNAIDRTLQVSLSDAGVTPAVPTYMEFIGNNDVVIAAFDNRIYKVDLLTVGLTAAQRFVFIGQVPGDYVVGMELWNQRIYIAAFSKSNYTSVISWTNGIELQGSYAIDGKFWITDIANFNGALFYSGGTQDGVGQVRLYPSEKVIELKHPVFDSRIRTLNAGRHLYFGHSHGTGVGTITERGASTWAVDPLNDSITNVVWDIEEVGDTVFFFSGNYFKKTTSRFASKGFIETSEIGGNTPLIDKLWDSITIETKPLSPGNRVKVMARNSTFPDSQWVYLGQMTVDDGIAKEFFLPGQFQSQWIKIRLELETVDQSTTPIVKKILTKYVPAALQKLQWSFSIRATSGLKMLDGSSLGLNGLEIANYIWDLRTIGRVSFRDKDEQEYDVIITDIKESTPLLDKASPESLVSIEILEA